MIVAPSYNDTDGEAIRKIFW